MTEPASSPTSMWQLKPWWCQPWSIILTGLAIPLEAWILFHRLWLVIPLMAVIGIWWAMFLYWVPRQYAIYLAQMESPETAADSE